MISVMCTSGSAAYCFLNRNWPSQGEVGSARFWRQLGEPECCPIGDSTARGGSWLRVAPAALIGGLPVVSTHSRVAAGSEELPALGALYKAGIWKALPLVQ